MCLARCLAAFRLQAGPGSQGSGWDLSCTYALAGTPRVGVARDRTEGPGRWREALIIQEFSAGHNLCVVFHHV